MSYKKIKNMTAAILLGCAVLSQSCTSWLDITPEAQVNDKKIFSTPQGFKDVLNGIYITASGEKLYANNLLFGFWLSITLFRTRHMSLPSWPSTNTRM